MEDARMRSNPTQWLLIAWLLAGGSPAQDPGPNPNPSRPDVHPMIQALIDRAADAPLVVAHRGKSDSHPENTLPAFTAALEAGAAVIEFDVRQSADGEWVCLHDATLDRTTDAEDAWGAGARIDAQSAESLRELDAGSWKDARFAGTRLPTLDEALAVIQRGAVAMIEHKAGRAEDMVALLRRLDLLDKVLLQSFDWEFLRAVHRLEPSIALGALGPSKTAKVLDDQTLARMADFGAQMVHWRAQDLTLESIRNARAAHLLVCSYTTDDEMSWVGQSRSGVHMITTNRPQRLAALRAAGALHR